MNLVIMALRLVFMVLLLAYLVKLAKTMLRHLEVKPRPAGQEGVKELCYLEVLASGSQDFVVGERISIGSLPFTIGRSENNRLVVQDPKVSSKHAEIYLDNNRILIRDLMSTNGTFVNGSLIVNHELAPMDKIKMGNLILQLVRCENEVQ